MPIAMCVRGTGYRELIKACRAKNFIGVSGTIGDRAHARKRPRPRHRATLG